MAAERFETGRDGWVHCFSLLPKKLSFQIVLKNSTLDVRRFEKQHSFILNPAAAVSVDWAIIRLILHVMLIPNGFIFLQLRESCCSSGRGIVFYFFKFKLTKISFKLT